MIIRGIALASVLAIPSFAQSVADSSSVADSAKVQAVANVSIDSANAQAATASAPVDSVKAEVVAASVPADSVNAEVVAASVPADSVNAEVVAASVPADSVNTQVATDSVQEDSVKAQVASANPQTESSWTVGGSWGAEFGYHSVATQKNEMDSVDVHGSDSILPGKKYKNYFQVPGVYAAWNAYVQMESLTGKKFEFILDATSDNWNRFDPRFVQVSYEDKHNTLVLGDMFVTGGELYLANIDLFGLSYDLRLGRDSVVALSVFGGENHAPKLPFERDREQYNKYIDRDEVEAQKMVLGFKGLLNASKKFNATLGFIGSKDYLDDPYFREGTTENVNLSNPMFSSKTLFAELNGKIMGGHASYNIQLGIGGADTLNVVAHRAVNAVFEEAGLDVSSFAQLHRLMNNTALVDRMRREELELIFGDNSELVVSEMRNELKRVLELANQALKNYNSKNKKDPNEWTFQNFALSGNYNWQRNSTTVEAYFRMVGRNYYSAGSPDMLQNSRLLGAKLETNVKDPWKLNVGYELNIENASGSGDAYNFFGFAEGSKLGLIPGADDDWLKKHEQDPLRTLYIHDFELKNTIKVRDSVEFMARYALNYRTRSTSQRLHGNYMASSGIYSDPWFAKQNGKETIDVETNNGVIQIDSARWAKYASLQKEPYLATQFDERLLKHTLELGATFKLPQNVVKVGGILTFRSDFSKFNQDELLDDFDFSDKTYGVLGYYFHGSEYFEMRIPISLTTSLSWVRNQASFMPRFRSYNRDEVSELEWSLSDNATIQLSPNFIDLMLNGSIRQNFMSRQEEGKLVEEMELDLDLSAGLRFQLTERLSNEWIFGTFFNYRPDDKSQDYRDIYGSMSVNLDF